MLSWSLRSSQDVKKTAILHFLHSTTVIFLGLAAHELIMRQ